MNPQRLANVVIAALALLVTVVAIAQAPAMFTLGVFSTGGGYGNVRSTPPGIDCPANAGLACYQWFNAGSTVTLAAVPAADSVFAGWSGACAGTGSCQVVMDAHKTVTATFNAGSGANFLSTGVLSDDTFGGGRVVSSPAGIDCGQSSGTCRASFPSSATVTLTAMPSPGARLGRWSGDCTGSGACQVSMDRQRSAYAQFVAASPETLNFTALWWKETESGWGINLNHQGDVLFATLFTYDAAGAPLWLVMSRGIRPSPHFYFEGDLYRTTGPAFNAVPFTPVTEAGTSKVGRMMFWFRGIDTADVTYTVGNATVSKRIRMQAYGSRAAQCVSGSADRSASRNYQDLWWNPAESGWGVNVTHQDDVLFATLFTYDATGRDLWLVMSAGRLQADGTYLGDLYRTRGPAFNANPFTPVGPGDTTLVGTMRFSFADGNNATLDYTYNGTAVRKSITRQVFGTRPPMCS